MADENEIKDIATTNSEDVIFSDVFISEKLNEISQIDSQIQETKKNGELAKTKANEVKTGFFKSTTKALDELKEVSIMNADANIQTLTIVNKLSENQAKMANACKSLVEIGAVSMARNRAIIASIKAKLHDGEDKELSEETKMQLVEVIRDLKQKQDYLERMERQGAKINELNQRVKTLESELDEVKKIETELFGKERKNKNLLLITIGIGLVSIILCILNLLI